ncbi:ATP-binding protein [Neolewinella sp.]|uniref:ATP-binding protein n=1 Tax=Neolewinella sp. TaxID=2993543 RepID=UPI003B51F9B5
MIRRTTEGLVRQDLWQGKVIVVLGPRQVGKTTLVRGLAASVHKDYLYLNGDLSSVQELLSSRSYENLAAVIGDRKLVVIDEAQRIDEIGLKLKILIDTQPETQLLVTGSSSLELSFGVNESLTGRKFQHFMYPLSFEEISNNQGQARALDGLELRLLYGSYPEIVNRAGSERRYLDLIVDSYLYKDLLYQETVRRVDLLKKILQALALQLGSEVSYNEVAKTVGADPATVEHYISLLEQAFVIFRLPSLSRNLRSEIKRGRKIYFWDNGVRNALIANFSPLHLRQDTGALRENFLVSERQKIKQYHQRYSNDYFWRTYTQQEVDYIEESDGLLHAFEFKWNPRKRASFPKSFREAYPDAVTQTISQDNFIPFLSGDRA